MANSLPVVASKVGAIPTYLSHDENAILIEPKSVDQIVSAVQNLTSNTTLRQSIIKSAFELVQENTLENQTKKLVHSIKQVTKP
jgi:glycosyltransferase involved in cell wall biosynthesis